LANNNYDFWLERRDLASGDVTKVVEYGFFPQISPDGERVLYLKVDLETYNYDLFMANIDGGDIQAVIPRDVFFAVDAPIWSPDSKAVIFSAVGEPTAGSMSPQRNWFADWFGVGVAKAHSVPSDLWRMGLDTGKFERLTSVGEVGINPAFSPDGKYLAFLASAGLWIMDTQSGTPVLIAKTYAFSPLQWVK
jgi:Tol biopolymer transport system component